MPKDVVIGTGDWRQAESVEFVEFVEFVGFVEFTNETGDSVEIQSRYGRDAGEMSG
jgi:hypothetical protein